MTIGYGHKITAKELKSGRFKFGITPEVADKILREDVKKAAEGAKRHFGEKGWEEMSQAQKDAAIDHSFNLGSAGLKKFPRWSEALRTGDWETVRKESKRHYKDSRTKDWVAMSRRNAAYDAMFVAPNLEHTEPVIPPEVEEMEMDRPAPTKRKLLYSSKTGRGGLLGKPLFTPPDLPESKDDY
jgi:GH24 family phage-related lysozyme (muramidase)